MKTSYDYINSRINYDLNTGIFTWKSIDAKQRLEKTWNARYAGKQTGYVRRNGYKFIIINKREYSCGQIAWLLVHKSWSEKEIDHINGDPLDNRILNLREATRSQNAINKGIQGNNSTGYKGVWKRRNSESWVAEIGFQGKHIKLGSFDCPIKASEAYSKKAKELHKEFART
ncbi:MAG: HNH endonuclease [Alphaproteobacteria bacterium]|nr:HNH endonuclease [Alphaproteobacteria bacterium]